MSDYKELSLKLFEELSFLFAENIDKHADLCRCYPELINIYVMNVEHDLKNEKISDYITKEEKELYNSSLFWPLQLPLLSLPHKIVENVYIS